LSDHHKRNKNIISNKKAFSSIVGAIFAVLVIVSLTGTFFVWSLQQNSRYVDAVSGVNDLVLYQKSESINVTSVPVYSVEAGGNVLVSVGLQNDGPISVIIKTLWLQDITRTNYGKTQLNPTTYTLSPGESLSMSETVSVPDAVAGDLFYGWLTTARGTVVQLYPSHQSGPSGAQGPPGMNGADGLDFNSTGGISLFNGTNGANGLDFNATGNISLFNGTSEIDARSALVAQGIGSLSFDFRSITYFLVNNGQLTPYPNGYQTYTVPAVGNIALGFNITNVNPMKNNVTLDFKTVMWSYFAAVPGHTLGPIWNIVSNQSSTLDSTYRPIDLNYNTTTFVLFYQPIPVQAQFDQQQHNSLAAINLLFFGNFTSTDNGVTTVLSSYGQNVPFVSLYFSP
jgi:hypothetical protein